MLIIGIAGGTGSGKSTVVRKIMESLPSEKVAVLPQDNYYRDSSHIAPEERCNINFDEPAAIEWSLLVEHIEKLKAGSPIEGILVLTDPELRKMLNIKVFVDADADERLIRVIARDCVERGRTPMMVINRYQKTLKPMHLLHIEPTKRYADIILPQGGDNKVGINMLSGYISSRLQKK